MRPRLVPSPYPIFLNARALLISVLDVILLSSRCNFRQIPGINIVWGDACRDFMMSRAQFALFELEMLVAGVGNGIIYALNNA